MKRSDIILSLLCFTASLSLYTQTLAPGLLYGDSAEFQTIAYTMGMGHPTGYPVYVIIAKIFSLLPIGEIAFRINLFSAVSAAVSIGFAYLIARKLNCSQPAAVFTSLALTLIPIFWRYASIAEVYTFSTAWFSILTFFILEWKETQKTFWGILAGAFGGLSFGVHTLIPIALPFFLLYTAFPIRAYTESLWVRIKPLLIGGIIGIAVFLIQFFFLDHRNSSAGYYNSTVTPSLSAWGLDASDVDTPLERLAFLYFPPQFSGRFLSASLQTVFTRVEVFTMDQLVLLIFAIIGMSSFFPARNSIPQLHTGSLFFAIITIWLTFALGYDVADYFVFYIPSLLLLFIFAGRGLDSTLSWSKQWASQSRILPPLVLFVCYSIGLGPYIIFIPEALTKNTPPGLDEKQSLAFQSPGNYKIKAEKIVNSVEGNAVIFTDWNRLYTLYYVAFILQGHVDMDFHQYYPQLDPQADITSLLAFIGSQIDSRPIYFTRYPAELEGRYQIIEEQTGLFSIHKNDPDAYFYKLTFR